MDFNIVLVNPANLGSYRYAKSQITNLGIAVLSAFIKSNSKFNVEIIDAKSQNLSPDKVLCMIDKNPPQILGLSLCVHESSAWSNKLIFLLKQKHPNVHVTLGGFFPSLVPQEAFKYMPNIDSIVIGEGELTFLELVEKIYKNEDWTKIKGIAYRTNNDQDININHGRKLIKNLDKLAWPDRYLAKGDGAEMEVMLEGTRGCYFSCGFCSVKPFFNLSEGCAVRIRSAQNIIDEIIYLQKKFPKLIHFRLIDPDFLGVGCLERSKEFAELIISKKLNIKFQIETRPVAIINNVELLTLLKKAGLNKVFLGIESGSQNLLKKMNKCLTVQDTIRAIKILKSTNIEYAYGFMMITPWSTEKDIEKNIWLLKIIGRFGIQKLFHELTLIPGSPLYDQFVNSSSLKWEGNLNYYSYKTKSLRIENYRKIYHALMNNFKEFFLQLSSIYDNVTHLRTYGLYKDESEFCKKAEDIVIRIFNYCWTAAKQDYIGKLNQEKVAQNCVNNFWQEINQINNNVNQALSKMINYIDFKIPNCQV